MATWTRGAHANGNSTSDATAWLYPSRETQEFWQARSCSLAPGTRFFVGCAAPPGPPNTPCFIVLDGLVDVRHFTIEYNNGFVLLQDSSNYGTWVNSTKIHQRTVQLHGPHAHTITLRTEFQPNFVLQLQLPRASQAAEQVLDTRPQFQQAVVTQRLSQLQAAEQRAAEATQQLDAAERQLDATKRQLVLSEASADKKLAQAAEQVKELRHQLDAAEQRAAEQRDAVKQRAAEVTELQHQLAAAEQRATQQLLLSEASANKQRAQAAAQVTELQRQLAAAEQQAAEATELQRQLAEQQSAEVTELQRQLAAAEQRVAESDSSTQLLLLSEASANKQRAQAAEQAKKLRLQLDAAEQRAAEQRDAAEQRAAEVTELRRQRDAAEASANKKLAQAAAQVTELQRQLAAAQQRVAESDSSTLQVPSSEASAGPGEQQAHGQPELQRPLAFNPELLLSIVQHQPLIPGPEAAERFGQLVQHLVQQEVEQRQLRIQATPQDSATLQRQAPQVAASLFKPLPLISLAASAFLICPSRGWAVRLPVTSWRNL